jgi:hypothetical protein
MFEKDGRCLKSLETSIKRKQKGTKYQTTYVNEHSHVDVYIYMIDARWYLFMVILL